MLPDPEVVSSSVLLAPDQSRAATPADDWVRIVSPRTGVISVSAGNLSGDPAPETLAALREAGYTVLRTDRNG